VQIDHFIHLRYLSLLFSIMLITMSISHLFSSQTFAQPTPSITTPPNFSLEDLVTYTRQSNFIKEFEIPIIEERGLKGIITDSQGNAWFYHSTNKTSTIIKFGIEDNNSNNNTFTSYNVEGNTVVDSPIINLAGGQLVFDSGRNLVWFTDARTNAIGKLDVKSGKIELISIPTPQSGPMGIVLSPDNKSIWFAEITGDKIASLDIESNRILEYPTGENTGPTLLTFDSKGILWVTLSYSRSILYVETWALIPNTRSMGMSMITLPKPDTFSPFGIAVVSDGSSDGGNKTGLQKMFVSDHGSSRIISSNDVNLNNLLQSYTSYWTSPSQVYPTTLPSQIVADKSGKNIYFPQHGGNRISKISIDSGIMTEYDIPTGPLSTALFIAVSDDGKKVWFTEYASNKVAYLDTTIPVPLNLQIKNNIDDTPIVLKRNEPKSLDVLLLLNAGDKNYSSSPNFVSLSEVELAIIGMSDSGLRGITYDAQPQRVNLENNSMAKSQINLNKEEEEDVSDNRAGPGNYTTMVKASAAEKNNSSSSLLFVSLLYPVAITLDIPSSAVDDTSQQQTSSLEDKNSQQESVFRNDTIFRDLARLIALPTAIALIGYIIYRRIKSSRRSPEQKQ
jgi:virginiamycin B lyase